MALVIAGWMPERRSTRIGAAAVTPIMAVPAVPVIDQVAGRLMY